MEKPGSAILSASAVVIAVLLAVLVYQNWQSRAVPDLSTPYHAVALTNNQVFFGKVDGLDTGYVVLREVFYIQSRQNPETKAVTNILVKRGGEWHGPDRMIVNREHVLLIEPVKADSQVAKLIEEQSKKAAQPAQQPEGK